MKWAAGRERGSEGGRSLGSCPRRKVVRIACNRKFAEVPTWEQDAGTSTGGRGRGRASSSCKVRVYLAGAAVVQVVCISPRFCEADRNLIFEVPLLIYRKVRSLTGT